MKFLTYSIPLSLFSFSCLQADTWTIETQEDWTANKSALNQIEIKDAKLSPTGEGATFTSVLKRFDTKRSAETILIDQTPTWLNWDPSPHLGPKNLKDAPVALKRADGDYWLFGRYGDASQKKDTTKKQAKSKTSSKAKEVTLEGYDIPLQTTPFKNQYNAPGGLKKTKGGYHAWQSKDMVNWVHHGPVSDKEARWMTTAEQVGNKTYLYYDFPNDQDPHLIIDENLTDGIIGKKMGMAFKDPSHGSDCAIIRSLDGKFHLILENWDPINAKKHSWDSPLASHAISDNGINDFKLVEPAVDYRTTPTGKKSTFEHPHWHKDDPANYPTNIAEYEVHTPAQDAFGDWAAISIGGQYYLFGDYDSKSTHSKEAMQTCWLTSSDINTPFTFCGAIGKGHPDPDIIFANNKFYLITQNSDFTSSGPWVDGVSIRVGVDTDNDAIIDQWTEWTTVKESYSSIKGFAKQVAKTPAKADLSSLPEGFGFQFEVRIADQVQAKPRPVLEKISMQFTK